MKKFATSEDSGISVTNNEIKDIQPILAKKIYDICKFQIFKKITIFHNILNIKRRLCLDCIRHFQRATSQC